MTRIPVDCECGRARWALAGEDGELLDLEYRNTAWRNGAGIGRHRGRFHKFTDDGCSNPHCRRGPVTFRWDTLAKRYASAVQYGRERLTLGVDL